MTAIKKMARCRVSARATTRFGFQVEARLRLGINHCGTRLLSSLPTARSILAQLGAIRDGQPERI
jgi:hypothetical protein